MSKWINWIDRMIAIWVLLLGSLLAVILSYTFECLRWLQDLLNTHEYGTAIFLGVFWAFAGAMALWQCCIYKKSTKLGIKIRLANLKKDSLGTSLGLALAWFFAFLAKSTCYEEGEHCAYIVQELLKYTFVLVLIASIKSRWCDKLTKENI